MVMDMLINKHICIYVYFIKNNSAIYARVN